MKTQVSGSLKLAVSLVILLALVPPLAAVGPGGDVLAEGCEEFEGIDIHHSNRSERYELLGFNFGEVAIPLAISVWIIIAATAKILFHFSPLPKYVPESCLLIAVGFAIGGLFLLNTSSVFNAELRSDLFFLYLLPPIMLEAGYFMPQKAFFSNLGSILMFAVVGTLFNAFTIGLSLWGVSEGGLLGEGKYINLLECLTFSSLISAVDPVAVLAVFEEIHVNQVLHILVFGESLLNDAVTVVLYRVFETFNEIGQENLIALDVGLGIISFFIVAFGGILVGIIFGFITAFITKYTYKVRVIEPIFIFIMSYMAYIIAEMLTLSSILSIVFCAMFMKPYVEQNISQKSHTTIKYFMKMMSSVSETIIFIFLGTTTLEEKSTHEWNTAFVLFTLLFCLVYRTIGVIWQVKILNYYRLAKINRKSQFIMAYGGIRGAIAFSLVALLCVNVFQEKRILFTTTIVVIMFTVFVQGITIKPLVNYLHVKKAEKRKPTMNEEIYERLNSHLMTGMEEIVGHHGHYSIKDKWEYINEHYIERILVRERKKDRNHQIIDVFQKLAAKDALEYINTHKQSLAPTPSSSDLLGLARKDSCSSLTPSTSNMLEVCEPAEPGPMLGTEEPQGGSPEGTPRRRRSSFSLHLEAFKKSAYRPHHGYTVRQSRHFLDDEDLSEPKPLLNRSLGILARHKTRKARTTRGKVAKHGRKRSSSNILGILRKSSTSNIADANGTAEIPKNEDRAINRDSIPTITITEQASDDDDDHGISFSVNTPKAPNGNVVSDSHAADSGAQASPFDNDTSQGAAPSTGEELQPVGGDDVKFSVEDETSRAEESRL